MKKKYTPAELEIILLNQDIITTSGPGGVIDPDDPSMGGGENEGSGGSGIGGGYNPGGWT